jgi:hypothetical protein
MIRFLLCCLLAFLHPSEGVRWVPNNVRFAGLREHCGDLQRGKALVIQAEQTGQSTQMRSSNTTMSRDESMALLKYYIKILAVLGLNTAFSLTMIYVATRLFGCCNYKAPLVALPLVLIWCLASIRVFKLT